MARRNQEFQSIHSEGGLLPPDLLRRILDPQDKLAGTRPEDYGLPPNERLNEVITQHWNRLRRHWAEFRAAAKALPEGEALTGLTNDKWSLPFLRELDFGVLATSAAPEIDGRSYAISRVFAATPVHLVGCGLSLDRRSAGVRGAAVANPHGLVQEFLNRSPHHQWGIVANGLRFRILRDSQALSRQSFLEFDLEAMFDGELYADFVLLWLVAHATRFVPRKDNRPESCWLEEWTKLAEEHGTRALGDLRQGVEKALQILGQGLVGHPRNTALREMLRSGQLSLSDFHGQLLRVIYRLIFLFVAEDRSIDGVPLLQVRDAAAPTNGDGESAPGAGAPLAARYAQFARYYGTGRLRELAARLRGSRHGDLWQQFHLVVGALSTAPRFAAAREQLALPVLGGFLWAPASTAAVNPSMLTGAAGAELANADFLDVIRHLAFTRQDKMLRPVDYKNLGSEELGGVYESLLALTPQISGDGAHFTFAEFAGNERKTSGSYYTPDCLVQCLLDSALDPVVAEALKGKHGAAAEQAILVLKVCDPACGSGHFLVGAAHRLARHLARVRALAEGESEPSPRLYQHALRDVIGHCLYGVDINPMAVELCRVSLWLEAMEPGKPLSFLDHHIQCGNSLIGAMPDLIAKGIPDDAFKPIAGDDKNACAELKKTNKGDHKHIGDLFAVEDTANARTLQAVALAVADMPDESPEAVQQKAQAFTAAQHNADFLHAKRLADAWCAAFVIKKRFVAGTHVIAGKPVLSEPYGITQRHILELAQGKPLPTELAQEVQQLATQYQFFHWHLAFPDVFAKGGFDCVLGNPPWEQVEAKEIEFFGSRAPEIASAQNASARKRMIEALPVTHPDLWHEWQAAMRSIQGEMHIARASGRYPLCARGRINMYALFAEHNWWVLSPTGRAGFIVPSGIATDDTTKDFFQAITKSGALRSLWEFENEGFFSAGKGHMLRFALTTLSGSESPASAADFMFQGHDLSDLADPNRHFTLSADDIATINPNTGTCPIFQTKLDALLALSIYRHNGVLWRENDPSGNPWGLRFMQGLFNMASDSELFRIRNELESIGWNLAGNRFVKDDKVMLPLYEAKMAYIYNHRSGSFEEAASGERQHRLPTPSDQQLADPDYAPLPCYWVDQTEVDAKLNGAWNHNWLLGWRDVTDARASVRTVVACVIPLAAVADTFLLALPSVDARTLVCLNANLCSLPLDYAARQKVGGLHLKYHVFRQLPVLSPAVCSQYTTWCDTAICRDWVLPRVLELSYTAWDLEAFARDCGYDGPPFKWDEERRFLLRCELDAAFFHLYLPTDAQGNWLPARIADGCPYDETPQQLAELIKHFPTPRDAVAYIMDTFPIVKRKDEAAFGSFRTKDTILAIYDEMAAVMKANASSRLPNANANADSTSRPPNDPSESTSTPHSYQTRLDPPPGPPCDANGHFIPMSQWPTSHWPTHIHPPKEG